MPLVNDVQFLEAYTRLNESQKRAVDTIDGPVMVIAGPGTGKTQVLTLRIANILRQTDTAPEQVLALTFTTAGARAMRLRLRSLIGGAADRLPIYTFHGFADRVMKQYPEAFPRLIGRSVIPEPEQIGMVRDILTVPELAAFRPVGDPDYYNRPLRSAISDLKQEGIDPTAWREKIINEKNTLATITQFHEKGPHKGKVRSEYAKFEALIEKHERLALVYERYEQALTDRKQYDFADMVGEVVAMLKTNEPFRLEMQETYQYVLADEHQDVNGLQNELLFTLTGFHDSPNLFVVGDEKQAIYRFQGASLENFLQFEARYPQTLVITLSTNYRSSQSILDLADSLVAVESDCPLAQYRVALSASTTDTATITYTEYEHQSEEDAALITAITNTRNTVEPSEIAVIVRHNREVERIATMLRHAHIPVTASVDRALTREPLLQYLIDILAILANPNDSTALARVLMTPYSQISIGTVSRVRARTTAKTTLYEAVLEASVDTTIPVDDQAALRALTTRLEATRTALGSKTLVEVVAHFLDEGEFLVHLVAYDRSALALVRRFYNELETLEKQGSGTLSAARAHEYFITAVANGVSMMAPDLRTVPAAVEVLTAHKAKGREFHTVFLPQLTDRTWDGRGAADTFKLPLLKSATITEGQTEDERRLLYVALTRAKRSLHLSYSVESGDGQTSMVTALLTNTKLPSPIIGSPVQIAPVALLSSKTKTTLETLRTLSAEYIRDRGFSATSLNNYLENPWLFVFRNVLQLPEPKTVSLQFGTAIHSVLESLTKRGIGGKTEEIRNEAILLLERTLGRMTLSATEYERAVLDGTTYLAAYLPIWQQGLAPVVHTEVRVATVLPLSDGITVPLRGSLDRLDISTDGTAVRVVDYKTGKPKTRNEIMGATKSSNGNYGRQLQFYALLLELYGKSEWMTNVGTLSFVMPDEKGRIHEETFTTTADEIALLRATIATAVATITAPDFLADIDSARDTEWAPYVRALFDS